MKNSKMKKNCINEKNQLPQTNIKLPVSFEIPGFDQSTVQTNHKFFVGQCFLTLKDQVGSQRNQQK